MSVRAARRTHPRGRWIEPGVLVLVEGHEGDGSHAKRAVLLVTVAGGMVTGLTFPIGPPQTHGAPGVCLRER
jgi:hypothetical protein